jgi:hypothetical protein
VALIDMNVGQQNILALNNGIDLIILLYATNR